MIAFEAGLVAVGGLLVMGKRIGAPDHHHGVMLAAAAGLLFGVSDVALKALTGLAAGGPLAIVASPWVTEGESVSRAALRHKPESAHRHVEIDLLAPGHHPRGFPAAERDGHRAHGAGQRPPRPPSGGRRPGRGGPDGLRPQQRAGAPR